MVNLEAEQQAREISDDPKWRSFLENVPGFAALAPERARAMFQDDVKAVTSRRLMIDRENNIAPLFTVLWCKQNSLVIFNEDLRRAAVVASSPALKADVAQIARELVVAAGWREVETADDVVRDETPANGALFSLPDYARSLREDFKAQLRPQIGASEETEGKPEQDAPRETTIDPAADTEASSVASSLAAKPQDTERWADYTDLLPGFSAMGRDEAEFVYANTSGLAYRRARKKYLNEDQDVRVLDCPGLGFLELTAPEGRVLLSPELQEVFLYTSEGQDVQKLETIARNVIKSAGWDPAAKIEDCGPLSATDEVPYYELGKKIEDRHRVAMEKAYAEKRPIEKRRMFVDELAAYYAAAAARHQKNVDTYTGDQWDAFVGWESESYKGATFLYNIMLDLHKMGVSTIVSAKGKDVDYQGIYDDLLETPELKQKPNRILFKRTAPRFVPDGAEETEVQPKPNEEPSQIDLVLERVKKTVRSLQDLLQSHKEQEPGAVPKTPESKDFAAYQKYLEAFRTLRFLKSKGIAWIGIEANDNEEKLLETLQTLRKAVENEKGELPKAGTPEAEAYIQTILHPPEKPRLTENDVDKSEEKRAGESRADEPKGDITQIPPQAPDAPGDPKEVKAQEPKAKITRPSKQQNPKPRGPKSPVSPTPGASKPVCQKWRRAKSLFNRIKRIAPAMVVSGLTGAGVRIAAHFALAAFTTTTPLGAALIAGSLAGGVAKLLTTSLFEKEKKAEKHWKKKAFLQGALLGIAGGALGYGVAHWLLADASIPSTTGATETVSAPDAAPPVAPSVDAPSAPDVGALPQEAPSLSPQETGADATIPSSQDGAPVSQAPVLPKVDGAKLYVPPDAPAYTKNLLSPEQFKALPWRVRSLASSATPREIVLFCKEASYALMNGSGVTRASLEAGARLLEHGLHVAQESGVDNSVVKMLHADYAYVKAWGIGTPKNVDIACDHARAAGRAVHHYGERLLKLMGRLAPR